MDPTLNSLTNDLDAARYFLTSSSLIIGVTAGLFFLFGLSLGYFVWAVYKRGFIRRGEVIESLKSENAMLKRRIAEPASRFAGYSGRKPSLTLVVPNSPSPVAASSFPAGTAAAEAQNEELAPQAPVKSGDEDKAALMAAAAAATAKIAEKLSAPAPEPTPAEQPAFAHAPLEAPLAPEARPADTFIAAKPLAAEPLPAVTSASEPEPAAPEIPAAPTPSVVSAEVAPVPALMAPPASPAAPSVPLSQAFSLWTDAEWTATPASGSPLPQSHAFSLWTGLSALITPPPPLPASQAITVWTAPDWVTASACTAPLPLSTGFSLWMEGDLTPLVPHWFQPSQAFSLWTTGDLASWTSRPLPMSHGYTVWTEAAILPVLIPAPAPTGSPASELAPVVVKAPPAAAPAPEAPPIESPAATLAAAAAAVHSIAAPAPASATVKPTNGSPVPPPAPSQEESGEMFIPKHQRSAGPLVARAIAAARMMLGLDRRESDAPEDFDFTSSGASNRSRAFTIWAETPDPSKIPVQVSLASLIGKSPSPAPDSAEAESALSEMPTSPIAPALAFVPAASEKITTTNGSSTHHESPFDADVKSGAVRHDFLLGMVYGKKPAHADDLTALQGLSNAMQQSLYNQGVYTFEQISRWTHAQVDTFSQRLGIPGVIRREHWVHQARVRCHEHLAAEPALTSASSNGSSNGTHG